MTRKYQELYELNLELKQKIHNIEAEGDRQRVAREKAEQSRDKITNAIKAALAVCLLKSLLLKSLQDFKSKDFNKHLSLPAHSQSKA